jgi:hypothetical protein
VTLPLDDEACLVLFELDYFYNHAPMFGNLKTIKVWVKQKSLRQDGCAGKNRMIPYQGNSKVSPSMPRQGRSQSSI